MYSPTTRLLTVLELLQSYKSMSGSEIARRLEVDVRTVRRYMVTLQDIGIPIEGERGPYGAYHLQRGHRLPPLMYSDTEAVAITLGLLAIREFHFPVDVAAVEGALVKMERVLPENLLQQVRGLQEAIIFNTASPPVLPQNDFLVTLSASVHQRKRVHLTYRSWGGDESERDFDPYGIVFNEGHWYAGGYCHLRRDLRTFRLDRIVRLETLEQSFERPENFDILQYILNSVALMPGVNQVEVILETTMERARQVIPPIMGTLEEAEKGVIFRRAASQLEWVAHMLISFDFPVFVVQPDELRDMLKGMMTRIRQMVGEDSV
jgi:predicted DNA-binding transcriptional regulator YafY